MAVAVATLGLVALQEDYDGFLATLYFTGVPEVLAWFVLAWFVDALGNRRSGLLGADGNSSEDGLDFQYHGPSSSTANLMDVSSWADSGQPRKSGVGQPNRRGGD
ncbi:hypothetical protein C8A05DRAFT_38391 [Staphylotrichum tortipilum]|uniref:Uncharacterized protein n=1 Tax=Staphylotrichum tortipilum TaxID=2831512 RepID=A0AAN6RNX1_9PEZI|nr:hypothetical protein C8A05DRAFT_38391 [Staphylotrichum longicolle]